MRDDTIMLAHGSGGRRMHDLVRATIGHILIQPKYAQFSDSAVLGLSSGQVAFTTDTYVVKPLEFPGGDIGTLAVSGTVNDLAVVGAEPRYLSCGLVIEEGFSIERLRRILTSMRKTADEAGVAIVTGDTKVVRHGEADGLYINTAGVGVVAEHNALTSDSLVPGDVVIVSGTVGDHGAAVMAAREGVETTLASDCAPLNCMIETVLHATDGVKFMRDATRGGVATVCNEVVEGASFGMRLNAESIPVSDAVRGFCETLGLDPLYVANEGKIVLIVAHDSVQVVLAALHSHPFGRNAAIIGALVDDLPGMVILETPLGGDRILGMLSGEQLPRIC